MLTFLVVLSLAVGVLNLVILIALANFIIKAADRAAQQPAEQEDVAKKDGVRMSDSGLVDVTTPSPYDGQLT